MAISFFCTQCGSALQISEEYQGKKVRCPHCQNIVMAPQASENGETSPSDSSSSQGKLAFSQRDAARSNADRGDSLSNPLANNSTENLQKERDEGVTNQPSRDNIFHVQSDSSDNPYGAPKSYDVKDSPLDEGLRHKTVSFRQLWGDVWTVYFRYLLYFWRVGLLLFLLGFVCAGWAAYTSYVQSQQEIAQGTMLAFKTINSLVFGLALSFENALLGFLAVNYALRLIRSGNTSLLMMWVRNPWSLVSAFFASIGFFVAAFKLAAVFGVVAVIVFGNLQLHELYSNGSLNPSLVSILSILAFILLCVGMAIVYFRYLFRWVLFLPFIFDYDSKTTSSFTMSEKYMAGNRWVFWRVWFCLTCLTSFCQGGMTALLHYLMPSMTFSNEVLVLVSYPISALIPSFVIFPLMTILVAVTYFRVTGQQCVLDRDF